MTSRIEVLHPGIFTTVQDAGRWGFAYFAVPRSGPVQPAHAQRANRLVGNRPGAPLLEFGLMGAKLRFDTPARIAITGADLRWRLDGHAPDLDRPVEVGAGAVLEGAYTARGRYGYLAVAGELVGETELGSVAMHARIHGRVEKGAWLEFGPPDPRAAHAPARASVDTGLDDRPSFHLDLLPGPEWDALTASAQRTLGDASWSVSPQSDRVGTRLIGPRLELRVGAVFESVPVWVGCVQVDPSGTAMVVGVDGGVVGGYPRVATLVGTRP